MSRKGLFVSFEGGDGAGKSTLINRLATHLEGKVPVFCTREPGGTALGEKVRDLLLLFSGSIAPRAELGLFLTARAQHLHEAILPALGAGKIVLCDRFNDSTIAYQAYGRGLDLDEVQRECRFFCEGIEPDLTFYLNLDPAVGIERVKKAFNGKLDRFEQEAIGFHQSVRAGFLALAKQDPERIQVIDAHQNPEQVFQAVEAILMRVLVKDTGK